MTVVCRRVVEMYKAGIKVRLFDYDFLICPSWRTWFPSYKTSCSIIGGGKGREFDIPIVYIWMYCFLVFLDKCYVWCCIFELMCDFLLSFTFN